jgi:hypothetical protein
LKPRSFLAWKNSALTVFSTFIDPVRITRFSNRNAIAIFIYISPSEREGFTMSATSPEQELDQRRIVAVTGVMLKAVNN